VFNMTKIAICVAVVVGSASAGFAKDQNARRARAEAVVETNDHSFSQARVAGQGRCWVPTRDQNDDEYGADTRGLGYWGFCREKGAVPSK
jgi:hypothetical protein